MKTNTFLIKASNNKEAVIRLPVNRYGGITTKGIKLVQARFSTPEKINGLKYALNLETFSSGASLMEAISRYQKNIL